MFRVREAEARDLEDLFRLAKQANFLNLPADKSSLTKKISRSANSFRGRLKNPQEAEYLFVLEDIAAKRVVGSSAIIGQHGTPEEPHVYFEVVTKKKVSKSLHIGFLHQVLRLKFDYDGPTEIGALVLLPEYRGHALSLGKFLSFARFMYIAARKPSFQDELHSELMPPFNERGESVIWEELGRKFTNLRYDEADRMSRKNKEFITSLFPEGDIYTCMLASEAREAIGQVGDETAPVKAMLESIGFKYKQHIDPFDGGPHFGAPTSQVDAVKRCKLVKPFKKRVLLEPPPKEGYLMALTKKGTVALTGSFKVKGQEFVLDEKDRVLFGSDDVSEFYFLEKKERKK